MSLGFNVVIFIWTERSLLLLSFFMPVSFSHYYNYCCCYYWLFFDNVENVLMIALDWDRNEVPPRRQFKKVLSCTIHASYHFESYSCNTCSKIKPVLLGLGGLGNLGMKPGGCPIRASPWSGPWEFLPLQRGLQRGHLEHGPWTRSGSCPWQLVRNAETPAAQEPIF